MDCIKAAVYILPRFKSYKVNGIESFPTCRQLFSASIFLPVGPTAFGSEVTEFQHRIDYVIQGFSGQSEYTFQDNVPLTDLGNGSDDSLWSTAGGTIGYLRSSGSKIGNTVMFSKAAENNLAGLIRVNKDYNCGMIEGNDCVPIFKGTGIDDVKAANGGTIPADLPFIAMSKDAGDILEAAIFNSTGSQGVLEMIIDVTNDQEQTIYVPCGIIEGESTEAIIIGAHHDTVYHGQGAVDDTSGTASVMEMARQLKMIVNETGTPERTIQFCTWGGEEEGLWGSKAYVAANIGLGNWGTAIARMWLADGHHVKGWTIEQEVYESITMNGVNEKYLPDHPVEGMEATMHVEEALDGVEIVVLAVPSSVILDVVEQIIPHLRPGHVLLDLAKGLAPGRQLISQAIHEKLKAA